MAPRTPRIWVVSELYYPEETSTGYVLTRIAESLARKRLVSVICSQPTYSRREVKAAASEIHNQVEIRRLRSTRFRNVSLFPRLINAITFSVAVMVAGLLSFHREDVVMVVTNPPLLPWVVWLTCKIRGARSVLIVHDLYPEVLVATGLARRGSVIVRVLNRMLAPVYRDAVRTVVLGRDMAALIEAKIPGAASRLRVIENWSDEQIEPQPKAENRLLKTLNLTSRFVINYAGNMGRPHAIELIADAAERLREHPSVHFLFIGTGAKSEWLRNRATRLPNVTLVPPQPRSEQQTFLNAGDVAIHAFVPGMGGLAVPSRIYNILAAGKAIIAVADPDSELARMIVERSIGWVVAPDDLDGLVRAINEAAGSSQVPDMGNRARAAAVNVYSFPQIAGKYEQLIDDVLAGP